MLLMVDDGERRTAVPLWRQELLLYFSFLLATKKKWDVSVQQEWRFVFGYVTAGGWGSTNIVVRNLETHWNNPWIWKLI